MILLIVAMRLAAGYHFFSEGLKKLSPDFTSEHFLRAAKGPLADELHAMAPGPHGAYELLARPKKWDSLSEEQAEEQAAWRSEYDGLIVKAKKDNEVLDAQFPPYAPYRDWAVQIDKDWQRQHDAFVSATRADDDAKRAADRAYRGAKLQLSEYLASVDEEIEEYQHKLFLLEELRDQVDDRGGTLPYLDDRIKSQETETAAAPRPWIAEVQAIEEGYHEDLLATVEEGERDSEAYASALNPPTQLDKVNTIVTWVVLGSGVLMFIGLFTRLAAVVAAGFLCSVIASQWPGAYGADATYLFYQVFEVTGLLLLAAVGAGRWLGFDAIFGYLFGRRDDAAEATA